MKTYSIIIPYRNRESHLNIFLPRLKQFLTEKNMTARIVVAEQADNQGFRRGALLNCGAKVEYEHCDAFILHDVDYIPTDNVIYDDEESDVYLPIKFVTFVRDDFSWCAQSEVSEGYQHFSPTFGGSGVDDDFWGAVATVSRDFFVQTSFDNGQKYWGFEDFSWRERSKARGVKSTRSDTNMFFVLNHNNNAPTPDSQELRFNMERAFNWQNYTNNNINTLQAKIVDVPPKHPLVDRWLECSEFDGPPKPTHIVQSSFNFDEGEE